MSDAPDPGTWLRDQMERRQLTTHDVAEAVGLRDQAVYYWLTGRTAPKDDAATKLAEVLDVPEVEVRRRFGLWVPEGSEPQPVRDAGELDEILQELTSVLERFRRWRSRD
jgi:transcriptional regulator with XRE-family HTH domain